MATVTASATRAVDAPPERVLEFLRDYREARPRILTDNYTAYRVEQGGHGAGHRDRLPLRCRSAGSATTG